MVAPGDTQGTHCYNFVYIDGNVYFAGRMSAVLRPASGPMARETEAVLELRNHVREQFFATGKLPD
jgi:hypothetical protein